MPPPHGHLLFVCTANICRSPMAEALVRHALGAEPEPLRSLQVLSAGVASMGAGSAASGNAIQAMKKVGLDLSGHRSRALTQELLDGALAVYCMTEAHRAFIDLQFNPPKNLFLMRQFLGRPGDDEIEDPYGGPLKIYETCRDGMVEAIPPLIQHLRTLL